MKCPDMDPLGSSAMDAIPSISFPLAWLANAFSFSSATSSVFFYAEYDFYVYMKYINCPVQNIYPFFLKILFD